jgi:hypothetical protein
MGFCRPQLVVVSSLFRWESLNGWNFLGHNLLLFQASSFTMEFWLSRSLCHELFLFHDGTLAITKPFSRTFFLFSRCNFGYHEAFITNFFLFPRWNFGYHEAFLTDFFFFHNRILAITKPFSRTFSFFTMELSGYAIWGKTIFIHISQRVFT